MTCWVIQGQAIGFEGESSVNHIWNCVQLDGDWYHVDATWDDYEDAPAATDRYYYFNLTTAELEKDHIISPLYGESTGEDVWCNGYVPECNSTDYYYFSLNAFALYSPDDYACSEYLAQAAADSSSSPCPRRLPAPNIWHRQPPRAGRAAAIGSTKTPILNMFLTKWSEPTPMTG